MKFVPHYADIAEPLRRLLHKDVPWEWTDEQHQAFRTLKRKLTSTPILAHFDPDAQTIVTTDESGTGLGAVLSQVSGGKERPVAYASKTLSANERKYSTGEREALACIFTLTTLLATSGSGYRPLRISRWSDRLHQYDFDIQYTAGSKNQVADMLSRLVNDEPCESMTDDCVMEVELDNLVTPLELKTASSTDVTLTQVRHFIQNGWPRHPPAGLETTSG